MSKSHDLSNFIWSIADLLRGAYRPPQYERVMLPLTVLRRFDGVLAHSKAAVLQKYDELKNKNTPNQVLESLFIERMEMNEEVFTDYLGSPDLQDVVTKKARTPGLWKN